MALPQGLLTFKPNQVCLLKKTLYGLKQASRQWFNTISHALQVLGYSQSQADNTLYTKKTEKSFTTLLLYVDDVLLIGNDIFEINKVKQSLHAQFHIKDLGEAKFFLGLEITRSCKHIVVNQRKYSLKLLSDSGLLYCKAATTPMDNSVRLGATTSKPLSDINSYRRLIGRLLYLTTTRLDIAFVVNQLSQFLSAPTNQHQAAVHNVLRYIKGSPRCGLFYPSSNTHKLTTYNDSN
uniref:Retrovirus-related Pol polyprotein from transposon TNT 1-94 n=1 Tax=Cajanus cajan TaxID=3821 RepID=A0A151S104_CAJCA|nr:Retrovirus-related Pol polyprotein from transposon TNT 1-94 [Cajanus cajan]